LVHKQGGTRFWVSKALIFIFSLFWRIFLRKTEWVLRNFRVCGGFQVEELNGCKFIEKRK